MTHNPAYEHLTIPIAHDRDNPEIVAADVEHRIRCRIVSAAKALAQISEINEVRMLGDGAPVAQGLLGFGMLALEVARHFQHYDVHKRSMAKRYIRCKDLYPRTSISSYQPVDGPENQACFNRRGA